MAEAFLINTDALVTKDYLDARLDTLNAKMDGKFRVVNWMLAVVIATTAIPAIHQLLS